MDIYRRMGKSFLACPSGLLLGWSFDFEFWIFGLLYHLKFQYDQNTEKAYSFKKVPSRKSRAFQGPMNLPSVGRMSSKPFLKDNQAQEL